MSEKDTGERGREVGGYWKGGFLISHKHSVLTNLGFL